MARPAKFSYAELQRKNIAEELQRQAATRRAALTAWTALDDLLTPSASENGEAVER